jgi:hypothetical protein
MLARLACSALALSALPGQAPEPLRWFKGNLHTHTLWSDGNEFPELVVDWYRRAGYQFLALSDHNVLADHDKWMLVDQVIARGGRTSIPRAKERFGEAWVETRQNDQGKAEVRLKKLDEVRAVLEEPGQFLLVPSQEITDAFEKLPIHINATNVGAKLPPAHGDSVVAVIRNNLRAVAEQAAKLQRPILAHLNHPNYGYAVTAEELAEAVEERFFEVYNGHLEVRQLGDDLHASIERMWDIASTLRISKLGLPPLYGVATDDSHNYHNASGSTPGRGWVMVHAPTLSGDALVAAMNEGRFYASTGVTLQTVAFDGRALQLEIDAQSGVTYETRFIGTRKGFDASASAVTDVAGQVVRATKRYSAEIGATLAIEAGPHPGYRLRGDELYVRAVVTASAPHGNPSFAGHQQQAWTQPVGYATSTGR